MPLEVRSLAEWEADGVPGMLSVVIPAHNEEGRIAPTVREIHDRAARRRASRTRSWSSTTTARIARSRSSKELGAGIPTLRYINNTPPNGFGFAVRAGLAAFKGDAVAIVMADASDSPDDLVAYYRKMRKGYDCVFGSRFMRGATIVDYPWPKLMMNRLANFFIRMLFWMSYNDVTNAFKMYRRSVIAGVQPLLAYHFNLTVELPLKAIVRGLPLRRDPDVLVQPDRRRVEVQDQGDGLALPLHRPLLLPREVPVAGGLSQPARPARQAAAGLVALKRPHA